MKQLKYVIFILSFILCIGVSGCKIEHEHKYIDGTCSCGEVEVIKYTVTFVDYDGTVLKTETVEKNHSATSPTAPSREGYDFIGWSDEFNNVTSNLTVIAQYKIISTEELLYEISDDETYYVVIGIEEKTITNVVIPSEYNSLPVKCIGELAFAYCESLTSITIPASVTSIGGGAFGLCTSLTSITIPASVTSIGEEAFAYCESLTSITIPASVTSIGRNAFWYCTSLTSITISASVTSIVQQAFAYCESLTSITIPEGVTSIESDAFENCISLTNITIPEGVTSIESDAFENCISLTNITIPSSVTSIGDSAFRDCTSLTSIVIPDSVTNIGEAAFYNCSSLKYIELSSNILEIGENAFEGCSSLIFNQYDNAYYLGNSKNQYILLFSAISGEITSCDIYDGTKLINEKAFSGCDLINIVIPKSVISIGESAFSDCDNLEFNLYENGYYLGNIANPYYALVGGNGNEITIHPEARLIGNSAFRNFYDLTFVIPSNVIYISEGCFEWDIIICELSEKPETWNSSFAASNCKIYWNSFLYEDTDFSYILNKELRTASIYKYNGDNNNPNNLKIKSSITVNDVEYIVDSILESTLSNYEGVNLFIPSSVTNIEFRAIQMSGIQIIYCENQSQPIGWNEEWCIGEPVIYFGVSNDKFFEDEIFQYILDLENNEATITRCKIKIGTNYYIDDVIVPSKLIINDIEYKVSNIGDLAFFSKDIRGTIKLPNTITSIGRYSFAHCMFLEKIYIPDSVTSIGQEAFYNCTYLTIYCEVESQPDGWSEFWYYYRPIYWGYNIE